MRNTNWKLIEAVVIIALVIATVSFTALAFRLQITWSDLLQFASLLLACVASLFAFFSARASFETVEEMRLSREAQERPYVIAEFDVESNLIYLKVINIGNRAAKDIEIIFEPELIDTSGKNFSKTIAFLSQGIPFLAPQKDISTFFETYSERFNKNLPMKFEVSINYKDLAEKKRFMENFILDISTYHGRLYLDHKDIDDAVQELNRIRSGLEDIRNLLAKKNN